jgi:hypothetical protein
MKLLFLATVSLLALSAGARAQTGNASGLSVAPPTTGGTARALGTISLDRVNVVDVGAFPNTLSSDSSVGINNALAAIQFGAPRNAYLPAATYHVTSPLNVGTATQGQCLEGDGDSSVVDISTDFSTTAAGVIVLAGQTPNSTIGSTPCVRRLTGQFHQPPDLPEITTQVTSVSGTTVTLSSVAGVVTGDYMVDITTNNAISAWPNQTQSTVVTGITGNVVTFAPAALAQINSGDTIDFAQPRANFTTLAQGCSLAPGAPGCKYPPFIYAQGAGIVSVDDIRVNAAWDGISISGGTNSTEGFTADHLRVGALDVAFAAGDIHNAPRIGMFESWNYGFNTSIGGGPAFLQNYYDGNNQCGNFGATDGLVADQYLCWIGRVVLNSNWSFGTFTQLALDGGSDLEINGGNGAPTIIGHGYQTGATVSTSECAINVSAGFKVYISEFSIGNSNSISAVCVTGTFAGELVIDDSDFTSGGTNPSLLATNTTAGTIILTNDRFLGSTGGVSSSVISMGTADILQMTDGLVLGSHTYDPIVNLTDNAKNIVANNNFNGWQFVAPGTLGIYDFTTTGTRYLNTELSINNGSVTHSLIEYTSCGAVCFRDGIAANPNFQFKGAGGNIEAEITGATTNDANYVQIAGAASGGNPAITTAGTGNPSLHLSTLGTGDIQAAANFSIVGGGVPTAPTCSGVGVVTGHDSLMHVVAGATAATTCTIDFGSGFFGTVPICSVWEPGGTSLSGTLTWVVNAGSIVVTSVTADAGMSINVECKGTSA